MIVNNYKIMKKKILIVLFCFFTLNSFSQKKPIGKYCLLWGGSTCIELRPNNEFSWETSGDLGIISVGKGLYEIKQSKLFLKFDNDTLTYDSTLEIKELVNKECENITIKLKFIDPQGQPLAAVNVISDNNPEHKYQSDINGILKIKNITKSKEAITVHTNNLYALENYSFEFIPKGDATLLITLHPRKPRIISGEIFAYKIVERSKEKLILKNTSGQILEFYKSK